MHSEEFSAVSLSWVFCVACCKTGDLRVPHSNRRKTKRLANGTVTVFGEAPYRGQFAF